MRNERQPNPDPEVKAAVEKVLRELNGANESKAIDAVLEALRTEHRTIQQKFWSVMLLAQIRYVEVQHDLRNEAAVKLAALVKETATKANLDYGLPYI